jgi:HSP20 family molecular chaperone IbpA
MLTPLLRLLNLGRRHSMPMPVPFAILFLISLLSCTGNVLASQETFELKLLGFSPLSSLDVTHHKTHGIMPHSQVVANSGGTIHRPREFRSHHLPNQPVPLWHDIVRAAGSTFPNVDVGETDKGYWIEISLPGMDGQEAASVEWPTPRELSVRGHITRPPPGHSEEVEGDNNRTASTNHDPKVARLAEESLDPQARVNAVKRSQVEVGTALRHQRFLIQERFIGWFHRSFSFPVWVDPENMEAKLETGILRIWVPKVHPTQGTPLSTMRIQA